MDDIETERAFDKLEAAIEDLAAAGHGHLATTIRLTVQNEVAEEEGKTMYS